MADDSEQLLKLTVNTIRAASSLSAQDIGFYRSLDDAISKSLDETCEEIRLLLNEVVLAIDENNDELELGVDKLEEGWNEMSNIMDKLFEKSDHSFDAITTKGSQKNSNSTFSNENIYSTTSNSKRIPKPQLHFKTPVDNTEQHPFKPLIISKPHALKPLEEVSTLMPEEDDIPSHYPHPYEYEIDHQPYNEMVLRYAVPIEPRPWDEADAEFVDTVDALKVMLHELKGVQEIALDLEHHDYRSYYGIVCLMQISTRNKDWLVDTIALREELHVLNEVFTDPNILKVLHGAFMDIIWLQRDLGLYIVSLFDTYNASKALGFPRHSLAYLLERFANFKTSKKYQLADWRIRPLTNPMVEYARADTHFLLNIYDQLRNSLIKENKLAEVLNESRNVSKRRFEYTKFGPRKTSKNVYLTIAPEAWRQLQVQYNIPSTKEPLLRSLFEWRDLVARNEDESPRYIMPNQLLVSLVALAPTDITGVLTASNYITDHVRANAKELSNLIKETLDRIKSALNDGDQNIENSIPSISSNLSLSQIQKLDHHFQTLLTEVQRDDANTVTVNNESLLFKVSSFGNQKVVRYNNGNKIEIDSNELGNRKYDISEKLSLAEFTKNSIHKVADEDAHLASDSTPLPILNCSSSVSKSEIPETSDTKEDRNEIIVLRKRKIPKKENKSNKPAPSAVVEETDYTKAKKILTDVDSREVQNKAYKKRSFDPYSQGMTMPAAVKKKKGSEGKSFSFKK
ncbi:HCL001Cp [Eremothecium sinecaudum]|uniref:HCL001Cp n=1 Tax=Eremothecium sinecaudum TaxID=45286 RepID=A0A0X8HRK7_9SACH|nr:HCL001Cp [Eremothecium sinecaudum]AMD20150.1 HCL001Cp [Eremothecium sinecaudum]